MLRYRIVSAAIGLPLLLIVTRSGGPVFLVAVSLLAFVGLYEFFSAPKELRVGSLQTVVAMILGLNTIAFAYGINKNPDAVDLHFTLLFLLVLILFLLTLHKSESGALSNTAVLLLGALYIGGFFSFLVLLRTLSAPAVYVTYVAGWSYDTCAYGFGRAFGRHKLAPRISPKKSVEGAVGGSLGALAGIMAFSFWGGFSLRIALGIAAATSVFAPLGDLFASLCKRRFDIKDYGSLIPGHGGVLDRFDSILFVAPVVFLILRLWS